MNRCVLIVDQDLIALEAIKQHVADAGYAVVTAGEEDEAIRQYDATDPAIVIFTVNATTENMLKFYLHITQETDWSLRPATIITGQREEMDNWMRTNRSRVRGVDVHISKPYNPLEMLSFVKRIFLNFQDGKLIN